ncbi:hypothetical protein VTJ04DRAFT_2451 [Mycothermus thermophilus]|uniref:uncharacterized protein n=1 Tax=Humicola insolens TaxID=85995 RepID=UPI0037423736
MDTMGLREVGRVAVCHLYRALRHTGLFSLLFCLPSYYLTLLYIATGREAMLQVRRTPAPCLSLCLSGWRRRVKYLLMDGEQGVCSGGFIRLRT